MFASTMPQGVVPGSIPLFAGHPAHDLLPIEEIRAVVDRAWPAPNVTRLFDYGDERGNPELINFLVDRLNRVEAQGISGENLMIIGGSTWGVDMIATHLAKPGDAILVDAPSYRDALHIFRDHQLEMFALPIDAGGARVEEMAETLQALAARGRRPKFYYVVPNFQNPSGVTMPEARRRTIVDLARQYGLVIVEDDVYQDIRFEDDLPPSFYHLAGGKNVLRLGSFSKTLAPGLRIGWLIGSSERIAGFAGSGKLVMGGGANPFSAAIVADFCQSGAWEKHLRWLRAQYRKRRDIALGALEMSMPAEVGWTRPDGGYFVWLRLPPSVTVDDLAQRAQARGVYFAPGRGFFVNPDDGAHHLRLSFSFLPLEDLRVGIETLGELIERKLAERA